MSAVKTVWTHIPEVWMRAVDLDPGAASWYFSVPALERLLKDIIDAWKTRGTAAGLVVEATDRGRTFGDTTPACATVVSEPLAAVVEWTADRGTQGVTAEENGRPSPPHRQDLNPEVDHAPTGESSVPPRDHGAGALVRPFSGGCRRLDANPNARPCAGQCRAAFARLNP
ncbi:hypothetical protein AB6813_01475 [bacterium RCC_150]